MPTVYFNSDAEMERWLEEGDLHARPGRLMRFKLLAENNVDLIPAPPLAYEYFEEARLCWLYGSFVATIMLAQLTFEEFLRDRYRVLRGPGGMLKNGAVPVDRAGFKDLVQQARKDGFLEDSETMKLHKLRHTRNPYAHTKAPTDFSKMSARNYFFQQVHKFLPSNGSTKVEQEAREAILTMLGLFPKLCYRALAPGMRTKTQLRKL